jgi:hypothetical protein
VNHLRNLLKEDFENYIIGARILGCGGGGGPGGSMPFFEDALKRGVKFQLVDISEVPKDKRLCTISGVGGGVLKEDRDRVAPYSQRVLRTEDAQIQRWKRIDKEISDYIGDEIYSYISSETGPGNGIMPMRMNAILGKPIVDGDCCGRAKPEIGLSLTHVAGIPMTPIVLLTPFDEVVIVKSVVDDYRGEDITRHVAVASGGSVTAARCPATIKEYEKGIAKGQITRCIKIGAAIKKAREKGADPVEAFQKETNAYKIFEGKVSSLELEGRGGFSWGNWHIDGEGEFKGKKLTIWVKNENLVSWLDGKPYAMCPDLVCVVDAETCEGLGNSGQIGATYTGKRVAVLGIKALEQWRTPRGIEIFGPKHFGFDIEYVPVEKVL